MPTVETGPDAYTDLERIRQRIDFAPGDFYDSNSALRFDELLVELEKESRGIFETLWGDQTPLTETDRVDTIQPTDNAAEPLVYPINSVSTVEYKRTLASDWEELDTDWYTHTDHRLILTDRPNANTLRRRHSRGNPIADAADRTTWGAFVAKLRVTYDRGFGDTPPADILSIQIDIIENMLGSRKLQQSLAAGSPEQMRESITADDVVTDAVRERVADVTKPSMATISV